ncbi:DinI-like family protein [Photobacterium damselae]|uniref:DinI-like family protein n=1 Tax=Photobacterium damselae TaxID=38293 RepID=UPI004067DC29
MTFLSCCNTDAIISVRKGGGNQISVNGLKKGDKQTTIDKIIDMFDEANEWLYIEEQ